MAEEKSGAELSCVRVCVYVVEFRLFSDLTYMCMCVCDICIRVRGSVFGFRRWSTNWSCSAGFHAQIMPDLTVDKSHQNICTFLMCKIHQNS